VYKHSLTNFLGLYLCSLERYVARWRLICSSVVIVEEIEFCFGRLKIGLYLVGYESLFHSFHFSVLVSIMSEKVS
jgi:hypothetical protein